MAKYRASDLRLARKAKRYGMQRSLRTIIEARRAGIPASLAFALVEQESSNGKNVFGSDPTSSIPRYWRGTAVTKSKYLVYKRNRRTRGMQGVGPLQLTWWATQDQADRLGGCWNPKINLRVGFSTLAYLIRRFGYSDGIRRYNGSGPAAYRYSISVRQKAEKWKKRLQ